MVLPVRVRSAMVGIGVIAVVLGLLRQFPIPTILGTNALMPLAPLLVLNHPGFRDAVLGRQNARTSHWLLAWLLVAAVFLIEFAALVGLLILAGLPGD